MGIEPPALPYEVARYRLHRYGLVEALGLEPRPDSLQESRSRHLSYAPMDDLLKPPGGLPNPDSQLQRLPCRLQTNHLWRKVRESNPRAR